jgi:hypothetical protein
MSECSSDGPNPVGPRVADLYAALDALSDRLRACGLGVWADRLDEARRDGEGSGEGLARTRSALRALALRERSSCTDEAIRLLIECDAIWRRETIDHTTIALADPRHLAPHRAAPPTAPRARRSGRRS